MFNYKMEDRTNMKELRTRLEMFSVNQMCCYQTLMEAFNVINHGSSEAIYDKWIPNKERSYPLSRNRLKEVKVNVPEHVKCQGFTFYGAKIWN